MEYLSENDFQIMLARLEITQAVRFGDPVQMSLLELYKVYGRAVFDDVTLEEAQKMVIDIAEAIRNEESSK